ncbi:MAG: (p)ppGpp synthetase [Spirochaetales bacterium]|nr:(p)ppGpp synthetase [Spirochaetales bacterium]
MISSTPVSPWLPDREALRVKYDSYSPHLQILLERLELKLRSCISVSSVPTYKSRVKGFNSYYRKLLRNIPDDITQKTDLPVVTDIIGIRIICAFLEDLSVVEKTLHDCFTVYEVERKGADRTFREFGYESTHVLLAIPEEMRSDLVLPEGLIFEIQVRTILQDAWAEVEHELVYKSEFSPFDLPLKRKLASINASLSLADIIFQEIRDYQNKLNRELDKRRGSFYHKADMETELELPRLESQLQASPASAAEGSAALSYVQGTIDDMILDAIEAHNAGNLERAVSIYSAIIQASPNETVLSVIYKHRGMAYFAQSLYEDALKDFLLSAEAKKDNFRAYYYIAIVQSVLNRNAEAVENFSASLALNHYQPYVYFRRAQSYYHLGMFTEALTDLDSAVSLGFNREEEKQLRKQIIKKIDTL